MRRLNAEFVSPIERRVHRVVDLAQLAAAWTPELRFIVSVRSPSGAAEVERLCAADLDNVAAVIADGLDEGDVVLPEPARGTLQVLFRETDQHHALFLTNRCNSYCLMCSQPPTTHADDWLIGEALDAIRHLRVSPRSLGLTGGEPLLLAASLRRVVDAITTKHPSTQIDVLTNGRLLADAAVTTSVLQGLSARVLWLVPLYGHADFVHDFVVQSPGAFEQTLAGLLTLQEHGQAIQLRVVLIEPVLQVLPELCGFIGRNLPFVHEVALMACEPIGFALANREACEVDLAEWAETLSDAAAVLNRHRVPFLFMNAPLCALPRPLWPRARRSISDWKNTYVAECNTCVVKESCCGLFAWHERGWTPTKIRAIEEVPL